MDGWIPGPTSSAASPSRRSCSKLALPWVSFGLQKFEHDDVIAVRARGTKSPLPSSSRNQTIGRILEGSHAATAVDHATNLLSSIYGQIYFPTYSNGFEGNHQVPWIQVVGLANVGARNDRLARSMGGIQGPRAEADATRLQPAGLRSP